tara:strand:+ start:1620 stop:2492 length:873 start_codon:yes stop_codon:yes gene_type:complete
MSRITTIHCPKILVSPLDTSIATFSNLGFNAGTLVNSGVSFFGGTLQLGVARAAVNIGPPITIPGVALPFSLWVDGISVFVGVTNFIGARFSFGFVQNNGFHQTNGAKQANGAVVNNGFVVDNAIQVENGFTRMNSNYSSPVGFGAIFTGRALRNKGFDIPHPTKKGTRVRHICVEGPESAVYIRGRLTGSNIIELPDYWDGLVDLDTVTISLTQIGYAQDLITEGVKWGKQVYVKSGNGTTIDCYYSIWANRIGPPLHVQYEGESPADYPGDQSDHSIAGYDYDVRGGK